MDEPSLSERFAKQWPMISRSKPKEDPVIEMDTNTTTSKSVTREATGESFCKVLAQSSSSKELGADACWMLTIIAHGDQPARYHNEELQALCGISKKRLAAARRKAIDAGWLEYSPAVKAKPGRYKTLIPVSVLLILISGSKRDGNPTPVL